MKLENVLLAICISGIAFTAAYIGYQKSKSNHRSGRWEVQYKVQNVYDDKCLDNMPGIEKFRSK